MAAGLEIVDSPLRDDPVPPGAVALVGDSIAFVAAEAVLGDDMLATSTTATVRYNNGYEARVLRWPCACGGVVCAPPVPGHVEGTRLLFLPAGTPLELLTPLDLL